MSVGDRLRYPITTPTATITAIWGSRRMARTGASKIRLSAMAPFIGVPLITYSQNNEGRPLVGQPSLCHSPRTTFRPLFSEENLPKSNAHQLFEFIL